MKSWGVLEQEFIDIERINCSFASLKNSYFRRIPDAPVNCGEGFEDGFSVLLAIMIKSQKAGWPQLRNKQSNPDSNFKYI